MKVEFLKRIWDMYRADVTAAIVELYIHRYDLGLSREQELCLDTLNVFSLRKDLSRNLWECAIFIDELLNDDEVSDFVNILLSESPRIENWPLCRILSQVLIGVHQVLVDIKREQWASEVA